MLQQILMNVLLQVIDLLNVRIVLVINVIRHEVHCLQAALNLTQVHLCKNGSVFVSFQFQRFKLTLKACFKFKFNN